MLTRRGVALLLGAVALTVVGRFLGVYELYVAAVTAAAVVLVGVVSVRLGSASVATRRSVTPQRLNFGGSGEVSLDLRNDARMPGSLLLVEDACPPALGARPRFVVPGLARGATVTLRYELGGGARGRYRVGPLRVRIRDPFGTAERVRRYRSSDELLVYPRIERLGAGMPSGSHHGSGSSDSRRLLNTGDEFHTMREYVTGDDLRQVHWRSTARRATLMIRQQEQPWQAQATILCDTRAASHAGPRSSERFERAVSMAASLVRHFADRRYQLRLVTETDIGAPVVERWEALLDRLAGAAPSRVAGLTPILGLLRAGSQGGGLLAAVLAPPPGTIAVARHPDLRALLAAGRGFSGRVALVVDPGGQEGSARARELAGLLAVGGWRAARVEAGRPFADSWQELLGRSGRQAVGAAFQPDSQPGRAAGG
jgi:uncharacterized protein (DUF58 family)